MAEGFGEESYLLDMQEALGRGVYRSLPAIKVYISKEKAIVCYNRLLHTVRQGYDDYASQIEPLNDPDMVAIQTYRNGDRRHKNIRVQVLFMPAKSYELFVTIPICNLFYKI